MLDKPTTISFVVEEGDLKKIRKIAKSSGLSVSAQVRVWVKQRLTPQNVDLNQFRGGE